MLTQLSTVKARLGIDDFDVQFDTLLTNALRAVSARFDKETNRTLARTVNATQEFDICDTEIIVPCYPIESVTKFETKENETDGWAEESTVEFLVRRACVISLLSPLTSQLSSAINSQFAIARVTYTGGYVLPGATPSAGQTALPDDLEQAAVEQAAWWFQHRDKLGLVRQWPHEGTYEQFAQLDLLPEVKAVLDGYRRVIL
jgi:hypothetical protein